MNSFAEAAEKSRRAGAPVRDLVKNRQAVGGQDDLIEIVKTMSTYYLFREGAKPAAEDGVSFSNQVVEPPDPDVYKTCRLRYRECRFPIQGILSGGLRRRNEIAYIVASAIHGFIEDCRQFGNDPLAGPPTWVLVAAEIVTVTGRTITTRAPTADDLKKFTLERDQVPGDWTSLPDEKRLEILGIDGVNQVVDSEDPDIVLRLVAADVYSHGPNQYEKGASGSWAMSHMMRHIRPAQALIARSYGVTDVARASLSPALIDRVLRMHSTGVDAASVKKICDLTQEQYEAIIAPPDLDPATKLLVLRLREAGESMDSAIAATGAAKTVIAKVWMEAEAAEKKPTSTKKEK
jgi:hypothetical protein